jgi:methionyl-tRNA synthetase
MRTEDWLVTATPPTPNGDLHLGHLSGPYLAADSFARHLRQLGADTVTLTGIDDHQSYTQTRGIRENSDAASTARYFGDRIVRAWDQAGISFDLISRPDRMPAHQWLTQSVFSKLLAQGDIVAKTRPLPYCPRCERWSFEAFVVGACPHCGSSSCGNACEVCGMPNDCADLADPHCTICGAGCETKDCERLYLPLAPHADALSALWQRANMNAHLTALCDSLVMAGLPEIAVSHPATWGIEVPDGRLAGQRIYVWFEMAAGYLSAGADDAGYGAWRPGRRVAQFFGFDNGYFHVALFPAIMHAFDPGIPLPTDFICNEFYRLDGKKFSTSRQHAIWLLPALEQTPGDHLRLYLSLDRPGSSQTNFTWEGFRSAVYAQLLPCWYAWLTALTKRCELVRGEAAGGVAGSAGPLAATIDAVMSATSQAYSAECFSPPTAVRQLDVLVRAAAEYGDGLDNLAGRPRQLAALSRGVQNELAAARALAIGLYPIAPQMAGQLWRALGQDRELTRTAWGAYLGATSIPGDIAGQCTLFEPPK